MTLMIRYLILISLILLISCGNNKDSQTKDYEQNNLQVNSTKEFNSIIEKSTIDDMAPEGLGLLIKRDSQYEISRVSTCTWFLISENIAASNSHCIPDLLKKSRNIECSQYIGGIFKTKNGSAKRFCKKILGFSDIEDNKFRVPDYAYIELNKPVSGQKYDIDRSGFIDKESFYITKINTVQIISRSTNESHLHGQYEPITCTTRMFSFYGTYYDKRSQVIPAFNRSPIYNDCKVIGGNSGSPVVSSLDKPHLAKAIVFAAKDSNTRKESTPNQDKIESFFSKINPQRIYKDKVKNVALISNFSCLKIPPQAQESSIPTQCNFLNSREKNSIDDYEENYISKLNMSKELLLKKAYTNTQFSNVRLEENITTFTYKGRELYTRLPLCLEVAPQLSKTKETQQDHDISRTSFIIINNLSFDRFGRLNNNLKIYRNNKFLQIEYGSIFSNSNGFYREAYISFPEDSDYENETLKIPFCN